MPATVQVQSASFFATADGGSSSIGPVVLTGTIIPRETFINLVSGDNSIAVPALAAGCIISPPDTNTEILIAKTTIGDVGMNIPKATPSILVFDIANVPTTLFLNAADDTTGFTSVRFF